MVIKSYIEKWLQERVNIKSTDSAASNVSTVPAPEGRVLVEW